MKRPDIDKIDYTLEYDGELHYEDCRELLGYIAVLESQLAWHPIDDTAMDGVLRPCWNPAWNRWHMCYWNKRNSRWEGEHYREVATPYALLRHPRPTGGDAMTRDSYNEFAGHIFKALDCLNNAECFIAREGDDDYDIDFDSRMRQLHNRAAVTVEAIIEEVKIKMASEVKQ